MNILTTPRSRRSGQRHGAGLAPGQLHVLRHLADRPQRLPRPAQAAARPSAFGTDIAKAWPFGDLGFIAYLVSREWGEYLTSEAILEMFTLGGARAMGMEKQVGSIEVGKRADIVIRRVDFPDAQPNVDVVRQLMLVSRTKAVDTVVCNGETIVRHGRLVRLDEERDLPPRPRSAEPRRRVPASVPKPLAPGRPDARITNEGNARPMTLVRFSNVSKSYGTVKAVADVSLEVRSGEFTTILGPSGSGKTTMLSLIAGIAAPTPGRIELGDRDITHVPAAQRNIGLVFQSYALFPHMSIFDNVAFPLRVRIVHRRSRERVSGCAAARAPVTSSPGAGRTSFPAVSSSASPLRAPSCSSRTSCCSTNRWPRLTASCARRSAPRSALQRSLGITTIMVTHDQEEALSLSDRVVLLSTARSSRSVRRRRSTIGRSRVSPRLSWNGEFPRGPPGTGDIVDPGGSLPCHKPQRLRRLEVCGVLRPEDIRTDAAEGFIAGTVRDVVFPRRDRALRHRYRRPEELHANVSGPRQAFAEGSQVWLSWDAARVWLLPEREGAAQLTKPPGQNGEFEYFLCRQRKG